jgi:hypothetical protein
MHSEQYVELTNLILQQKRLKQAYESNEDEDDMTILERQRLKWEKMYVDWLRIDPRLLLDDHDWLLYRQVEDNYKEYVHEYWAHKEPGAAMQLGNAITCLAVRLSALEHYNAT